MKIAKHGIDNLKKLLAFTIVAVVTTLDLDQNKDGKLSASEGFSAITTLSFRFPELVEAFPMLKKEWKDLDDGEIKQLVEYVNQELDLPMRVDHVEMALKLTINMLHYNYRYYKNIRAIFSNPRVA